MVYYDSHSMIRDAMYSTLCINVTLGLRPAGRINYSYVYQGKEEAEILTLRLFEYTGGKNLCHWGIVII